MKIWVHLASWVCVLGISGVSTVHASNIPALSQRERESMRFHLENLFNELDLLIRNQRADLSDIRRQEREFAALGIYERIPLREDITGLKRDLSRSARAHGVKLVAVKVTGRTSPSVELPGKVYSDERSFRLGPDQVAQEIFLQIQADGGEANIGKWIQSWSNEQARLIEPETGVADWKLSAKRISGGRWAIRAQTFRFKDVRLPTIVPRDPMEFLPNWARENPGEFAKAEPRLWHYVTRIQELAPKATPLYRYRSTFLLNDRRMAFFLSKADVGHGRAGRGDRGSAGRAQSGAGAARR